MNSRSRGWTHPPWMRRRPDLPPESQSYGATPIKEEAWRRSMEPSAGMSAHRLAALAGPKPGTDRTIAARREALGGGAARADAPAEAADPGIKRRDDGRAGRCQRA